MDFDCDFLLRKFADVVLCSPMAAAHQRVSTRADRRLAWRLCLAPPWTDSRTVFAGLFGAGKKPGRFLMAFRLPNLLRDLLPRALLDCVHYDIFTKIATEGLNPPGDLATKKVAPTRLHEAVTFVGIIFAHN